VRLDSALPHRLVAMAIVVTGMMYFQKMETTIVDVGQKGVRVR
jgi:hypothetical protein